MYINKHCKDLAWDDMDSAKRELTFRKQTAKKPIVAKVAHALWQPLNGWPPLARAVKLKKLKLVKDIFRLEVDEGKSKIPLGHVFFPIFLN